MPAMAEANREVLIEIVERFLRGDLEDDAEVEAAEHLLKVSTGNPHVLDLIFWPDPGDESLTAAQIVDKALEYKPFAL